MINKKPHRLMGLLDRELWFLECRGREIRTPDLLLPKQALIDQITVDKSKVFFICVPNFRVPKPRFHWFVDYRWEIPFQSFQFQFKIPFSRDNGAMPHHLLDPKYRHLLYNPAYCKCMPK